MIYVRHNHFYFFQYDAVLILHRDLHTIVLHTVSTMKQLYNSSIFPYIDHCVEVWGRIYPSNVNPVYVMQNKAIRIILNAHYNEHTNNYFIELNTLKLFYLLKYKNLVSLCIKPGAWNLVSLCIKPGAWNLVSLCIKPGAWNLVSLCIKPGAWNLVSLCIKPGAWNLDGNFQQFDVKTTIKQMCITMGGSKLWNSLDTNLKEEINIHKF